MIRNPAFSLEFDSLRKVFRRRYGRQPEWLVRAPGRVNLLGEHTDYNDGYVFPAAIDRYTRIAAGPGSNAAVRACSLNFQQAFEFQLDRVEFSSGVHWANYLMGVVAGFQQRRLPLSGMDLVIAGDLPIGAGLSSSASLEVAVAEVCRRLNGIDLDDLDLALLCQEAERSFVGVQCGIMDQFVVMLGRRDSALKIDCRTLEHEVVPLAVEARIVVIDSRVVRTLDGSAYNQRKTECQRAVDIINRQVPGISSLRDVTRDHLKRYEALLPPPRYGRALHVVTENQRVLEGVEALKKRDLARFGELMYASHESLRDQYEVSCPQLDLLVELARGLHGVCGSRMTGAGFGGCTVSLVKTSSVEAFCSLLSTGYRAKTGTEPAVYVCNASDGVQSERI